MSRNPKSLTALIQEAAPAFRAWFDGSKVVTEEGNPAVCTHYTDREFSSFSADEQKRARSEESGYTTSFGSHYVFPETGFFFFVGETPWPVGHKTIAVQTYLSIKNPLDLTQRISPEDASRIIDFIKQRATLQPRPGHHGYTPRGDKLGGFRNARKEGVTAQQLWEFLNENLYTRRALVWDQMLAVLGKDGVIFEGNSSGTSLLESERGMGDGKTYRVAVAINSTQIKFVRANTEPLGFVDKSNCTNPISLERQR